MVLDHALALTRKAVKWQVHRVSGRLPAVRVFQIGFNKSGTTSIHKFMRQAGVRSVHFDDGHLARRVADRIRRGEQPLLDYPLATGFTDMEYISPGRIEEPYRRFDILHHWYPNALFILNTRDEDAWIASREQHICKTEPRGPLTDRYMSYYGCTRDQLVDLWRADRKAHHARVRAYFRGSDRFLDFRIDRDAGERLRDFLLPHFPGAAHAAWNTHNSSASRQ